VSNRVLLFVPLFLLAFLAGKSAHAGDPANIPVRPSFARSGDYVVYEPRPVLPREVRACSFRHALCVHAQVAQEALALLAAAEGAWDVAVGVLDLPPPDASPETGVLDVYLVDGDPYATRVVLDARDVLGGFDRASAFGMVGRGVASGCHLDGAAARIVSRAVLFRVAPATDEGSAIAETTYLSSLMVPCAPAPVAGLLLFQAHPELGLTDKMSPPVEQVVAPSGPLSTRAGEAYASGASSFYAWTDRSFAVSPGAMVRAIWALSPTLTPLGAARWNNEPDGFEVLRMSFRDALGTKSTVDDLWLDFAVSRAFDAAFPVRFEWSIDWPARPRSLMSAATGVAPTGAAFIGIDCSTRPKGARLRFEATWEEHARMLWTLVRVDAAGHEMSRVGVPSRERGTDAQLTLVDLDSTARVIVVGVSAGDPLYPFDPDDYRQEPHGWVVSLSVE
jgi:hypothetical protein